MICFLPPKPPAAIVEQQSPDRDEAPVDERHFEDRIDNDLTGLLAGDWGTPAITGAIVPGSTSAFCFALPPDPELIAIGNAALERWWRESHGNAAEGTKARSVRRAGRSGKLTPTPNSL